jgi:predicted nucleic acid-binding protein
MGLILDSRVDIAAERRGDNVPQLLRQIYRAHTSAAREQRQNFLGQLLLDMEVVPYTEETALLAGRLDEQRAPGVTIPSMDLLIGATALENGYSLATKNLRHFKLISSLNVISL